MAKANEAWREEIEALRAEVEELKAQKDTAKEAATEAANEGLNKARAKAEEIQKNIADVVDQAGETIAELQKRFNEGTQTAEETVSQHPLATLASAFLLGLIIGRISR